MWIEQVRADIALVSGLLGPDKSLHPWCSTLAWIRYGILHDYKLSIKKVKNDVSAFILAWLTLLQDNHKKFIFLWHNISSIILAENVSRIKHKFEWQNHGAQIEQPKTLKVRWGGLLEWSFYVRLLLRYSL